MLIACNTEGYSSTYLAMGLADVRAGTQMIVQYWIDWRNTDAAAYFVGAIVNARPAQTPHHVIILVRKCY